MSKRSKIYKNVVIRQISSSAKELGYCKTNVTKFQGVKTINYNNWFGPLRDTEREAAIDVDKHLIILGLEPVNILKRK